MDCKLSGTKANAFGMYLPSILSVLFLSDLIPLLEKNKTIAINKIGKVLPSKAMAAAVVSMLEALAEPRKKSHTLNTGTARTKQARRIVTHKR